MFSTNIPEKKVGVSCWLCRKSGFFTYYVGHDSISCPLCKSLPSEIPNKYYHLNNSSDDDEIEYCNNCKLLYKIGCIHSVDSSGNLIYNSMLVKDFAHLQNGEWIDYKNQIPLFKSHKDYLQHKNEYIFYLSCMCDETFNYCSKADEYYKKRYNLTQGKLDVCEYKSKNS